MLFNNNRQSSYTAFAYDAQALMRFINNLAAATEQTQLQVMQQVEVENKAVCDGRQKAIIRYSLHAKSGQQKPDYFKDVDSRFFIWPSERIHAC